MKKVFFPVVVLLLCAGLVEAGSENIFKIGADVSGNHKVTFSGLSGSAGVNTGFSISGESIADNESGPNFGFGGTYLLPRAQTGTSGNFSFLTLYALLRTNTKTSNTFLTGHLGYNLLFSGDQSYSGGASLSGGLYYGVGAGYILQGGSQIEVLYSVNQGSASMLGMNISVEYSKVTISYGFSF